MGFSNHFPNKDNLNSPLNYTVRYIAGSIIDNMQHFILKHLQNIDSGIAGSLLKLHATHALGEPYKTGSCSSKRAGICNQWSIIFGLVWCQVAYA